MKYFREMRTHYQGDEGTNFRERRTLMGLTDYLKAVVYPDRVVGGIV